SPPLREGDADAVEGGHRVFRGEVLGGALHDLEFAVVGAVDTQLRSGDRDGKVGEQPREGPSLVRHVPQQACGGEQGVVEAVPVAPEEHVPAHLARERCARLFHLLLDEGMAGLPHRGHEARPRELARQHFRALHVEDHGVARTHAARQVATEQHEQLIAEHGATPLVHRADAVSGSVEGDPQLAALAAAGRLQVAQVLQRRRVRVMIGERTVGLAEQRNDFGAEALEGVHRDEARDAIAAIHDDLDLARERAVALYDGIAIARQHRAVLTARAPRTTGGASLFDQASKALDAGAGTRSATVPRMSYSRKMAVGSFMGAPGVSDRSTAARWW